MRIHTEGHDEHRVCWALRSPDREEHVEVAGTYEAIVDTMFTSSDKSKRHISDGC